jgi:hypothetical protein
MANHVYTNINIRFDDSEALRKFTFDILEYDKWMSGKLDGQTYWERISKLQSEYFKIICPDVEETRSDYIDKLGAKWISFEDIDFDDDEMTLTITSAWSPAFGLFERIYKHVAQIDPEASLVITWEDEGFNFIGAASYNKFGDDFDEYEPTEEDLELLSFEDPDEDRSDEFYELISDKMNDLTDCVLFNTSFTLNKPNE